ncbi:hypothetical protein PVT67_08305 [Gallaecimonas kandeliae]|uniref:hypothetical protein n=1 Tax=Gallaecimonas kandeliae TaxID=3029055 RepID=UPI0026485728|nr:hypothetical protein [Gallaecimonas kandeliae]WKE67224.1 hypothetical protein PVT67_08305 [Gallaecimonas kandeliae]
MRNILCYFSFAIRIIVAITAVCFFVFCLTAFIASLVAQWNIITDSLQFWDKPVTNTVFVVREVAYFGIEQLSYLFSRIVELFPFISEKMEVVADNATNYENNHFLYEWIVENGWDQFTTSLLFGMGVAATYRWDGDDEHNAASSGKKLMALLLRRLQEK